MSQTSQRLASTDKVLILGSSVNGGANSREARAAIALGYPVTIVTPAQWLAMKASQFMEYRAIIIGDAACQTGTMPFRAALDTRNIWGAIVDGSVVIVGADPTSNGTTQLVESAVEFALRRPGRTGMYVALGCGYRNVAAGTTVPLLSPFGEFKVAGVGCADLPRLFRTGPESSPWFSEYLDSEQLRGAGGCGARTVFTSYPSRTFAAVTIAMHSTGASIPGEQSYTDYDTGETYRGAPYILLVGNTTMGLGCGVDGATGDEQCDLGDRLNGKPAIPGQSAQDTCSWSCQQHWCGDGAVDTLYGEECDNGSENGRTSTTGNIGSCSAFCRIPNVPPETIPPQARCQNVTVIAQSTCGMDAVINNGSSDPDGDLVGCTQSPPGPYPIGATTATLTCTDLAGNSSSCTGTVTVTDAIVPTITLNGPPSQTLECGAPYSDPWATASDLCSGDMTSSIVRTGAPDTGAPGSYTVSYDVTDLAGNSPEAVTRSVTVQDTLKPVLTLLGLANQGLECGGPFYDPGATAADQCAGDLTSAIVKTGTVSNRVLGSYPITYDVKDPSNNAATPLTRVVTVSDTRKPSVMPRGSLVMTVECGDGSYVDPGANANDMCAGVLPAVANGSANPQQPGTYTFTYSATDPSNNVGVSPVRTVTVSDTQPPTLTRLGAATQALECGTPYVDPGATATDMCAGDLSAAIVRTGTLSSGTLGTYTLTYNVTDPSGRSAPSVSRTVQVTDTLAPSITLRGPANDTLACGSTYVDPGATATDLCAGDLTSAIIATRTNNPSPPGSFTISYRVSDPTGNSATSPVTRTVTVRDDQPPVLALTGPAVQQLECGSPHVDPGATANDACFGDITHLITRTGTVNPQAAGSYTLTYNVTDPGGQSATPVTRRVDVLDSQGPALTVNGPLHQQIECGLPYTDPGAKALDLCAGDLSAAIVTTGSVNASVPGDYTVNYSVKDPSGREATGSRTVAVRDTLAPSIQLNPGPSVLQCNSPPYVDPGAWAYDLCFKDLTSRIVVTSNLDQTRPGQYAITYRVVDNVGNASTAVRPITVQGTSVRLGDYNLFLLENYSGGRDVQGRIAAGGNIHMTDFTVGAGLHDSDITRTLVAGGNLTLSRGGIWGDAFYGGTYSADGSVVQHRGTLAKGTPINFAARFTELRNLSSRFAGMPVNGTATREAWGGIIVRGTDPVLNIFQVNASIFTGAEQLSIEAPTGSTVVINIQGASATFTHFATSFSGIDQRDVIYNFVDATTLNAYNFGFWGTVLAPYAHVTFNTGSWDGGIYAVSLTGNGEGHINPVPDREFCQ